MIKKILIVIVLSMFLTSCSKPGPIILDASGTGEGYQNVTITSKTIFYDNFSYRKGEWQQIRGNWTIRNGSFVQNSADPRHINSIIYVDHPQVSDATIETLVRITPDLPEMLTDDKRDKDLKYNVRYTIGAGIVFRMTKKDDDERFQDNFYMFRLAGEEGAVLGKMVNNQWVDLANPRSSDYLTQRIHFSKDYQYRLKVEAYGDQITCYINDSVVATVKDSTFALGRFGLCTFKTRAEFDRFNVYNKNEKEIR